MILFVLKNASKTLFYRIFGIVGKGYLIGGIIYVAFLCVNGFIYYTNEGIHSVEVNTVAGRVLIPNGSSASGMSGMIPLFNALNWKFPRYTFIIFWSPTIYFLSGTNNPTMLNTYVPLYNTQAQVNKVIKQLEYAKPKLIIIDGYLNALKKETYKNINPKVFDINNDPLVNYITKHYFLYKKVDNLFDLYKPK